MHLAYTKATLENTNVALVEARRIFIWKILLSSRRYSIFYLISKICLLKMSVSLRREQYFRKKCASRLDESNIETNIVALVETRAIFSKKVCLSPARVFALVEARRIFIWIILFSSKRYVLFYITSKRFLLKMSVWCRRER